MRESVDPRYTDGTYVGLHGDWHEADAPWKAQSIIRILTANHISPSSMLDVGCGTGSVLDILRGHFGPGSRYVGVEPSDEARRIGARHVGIELNAGTLADVGDTFDVGLALDVFEHVEDYMGFLRQLASHVTWAVFHIPLDLSAQSVARFKPLQHAYDEFGHLHYFTRDTAFLALRHCGYEVVDEFYTSLYDRLAAETPLQRLVRPGRALLGRLSPHLAARLMSGWSLVVLARVQSAS